MCIRDRVIGMVGKLDNVEKAISSEWKNIDDQIWLIGSHKSDTTIAASSYLEYFHGEVTGRPPKIDLLDEKFCQSFLRNAILKSFVVSSHDISDGGLAIALAESCILSAKGATIELEKDINRDDNLLFAEGGSRIIFSISKVQQNQWLNYLKENQINFPSSVYVKKIKVKYFQVLLLQLIVIVDGLLLILLEELSLQLQNLPETLVVLELNQ